MGNFALMLAQFMQGRYGMDELNRSLFKWTAIAFIIGVIANLFGLFIGRVAYLFSSIFNFAGSALMLYAFFRILSRNIVARQRENERYLSFGSKRGKSKREQKRQHQNFGQDLNRNFGGQYTNPFGGQGGNSSAEPQYLYMTCPFCGQDMRIPRGKGKIAVRCPKCGEKTITTS